MSHLWRLPVELIREILFITIDPQGHRPGQLYTSWWRPRRKPSWAVIGGATLASKSIRAIALQAWFYRLYIEDGNELSRVVTESPFPELVNWVKQLEIGFRHEADHGEPFPVKSTDLRAFQSGFLNTVIIHDRETSLVLPLVNIPHSVRELELLVFSAHPSLFKDIASKVPSLRVLGVLQFDIWCSLCNLENEPTFLGIPSSLTYTGGTGLPKLYGLFLAPLRNLTAVNLTICCQDTGKFTIDPDNADLWCGECEDCVRKNYSDEGFRKSWVDAKSSYTRPPALATVTWDFVCF